MAGPVELRGFLARSRVQPYSLHLSPDSIMETPRTGGPTARPQTTTTQERSLFDLVRNLRDEGTTLVRQEVALAKAEMGEKVSRVGRNLAYAVVGGAVAHLALIFVLLAAVGAIDFGVEQTDAAPHGDWIAPLVVGLVVGGIGVALLLKAKSALTTMSMAPEQTIASLTEDKKWVQKKVA